MKELPVLGQTEKVQPSLGSSNFGAAMSKVAEADLQIANFGAEIALDASTKRAKLAGYEAGKTPSDRTLFSFTKSDQAYADAYKQEAMATQDFKGKQLLNDMFTEVAQNPTRDGLMAYKNQSLLAVQEFARDVPKELQGDLMRSLETTAQNNFYSLENAWNTKAKEDRVNIWKQSTDQSVNMISDLMISGDHKGATELAKQKLAETQERETSGDIAAGTSNKLREMLDQTLNNSQAIHLMNRSGDSAKFLANMDKLDWINKLPSHVKQGVISNAVNYFNQQEAAKGAQQGINYTNYQTKIMASQMTATDWMQAPNQVSGQQFAKLEQQQMKINIEANQGYAAMSALAPYIGNASVLAGQSPKTIESMQDYLIKNYASQKNAAPIDLSMTDQAQALVGMHAPAKNLTNQMSAALRSGSINEAIEASHIHQFGRDLGNNELTSGLSAQDKMFSNLVKEKSKNVEFSPKDLEDLRQATYNATDEQKANGIKAVSEFKRDNGINSFEAKMDFIKDKLGAYNFLFQADTVLPNDIADTFDNLLETYGVMTRDPSKATELAIKDLNDLYKETKVNGYTEKMALPPNQFIPDVGYVIENSVKASFAGYVDRLHQAALKGQVNDYNINWQDRPKEGNPFDYSSRWGDKGPITFLLNGREARLIVKTDNITAASAKNTYTEYGVKIPNQNDKTWALWFEYTDSPGASYQLRDFITHKGDKGQDITLEQGARYTPVEVDKALKSNAEIKKIIQEIKTTQEQKTKTYLNANTFSGKLPEKPFGKSHLPKNPFNFGGINE